jgi:hypothetical protein
LSRTLRGAFNLGYSRYAALGLSSLSALSSTNQNYDYWTAGVNLSRPWGRSLNLFLNYQLQYQNSNNQFCTGAMCQTHLAVHMVSVGFSWRDRPLLF